MSRLSINLSVGRACFTRCDGCYNHFGKHGELTSTPAIVEFLRLVCAKGIRKVTLCGGDPLSRPDILELLTQIKALGFSINLDTMGTVVLAPAKTVFFGQSLIPRVDPEPLARLIDLIGIPVDGASDEIFARFRSGRPNLVAEQLRVIDTLGAAGARVCVNTVVHNDNLDDIINIVPLLAGRSAVAKWQLFQFAPIGPLAYRNRARYSIRLDQYMRVKQDVVRASEGTSLEGKLEFKTNTTRKLKYLLVDSDGVAFVPLATAAGVWDPALDASDERLVLGNIRDASSFPRILSAVMDVGLLREQLEAGRERTASTTEDQRLSW